MATSIVLQVDSGMKQWHSKADPAFLHHHNHHHHHHHHHTSGPTISSTVASDSMAGLHSGIDTRNENNTHKPRLPSFSNFLSSAGRPHLNFNLPPPGPSVSQVESQGAPPAVPKSIDLGPGGVPANLYGNRDVLVSPPLESSAPPTNFRPDFNQSLSWPHANINSRDHQPPLPSIPHQGQAADRAYGRVVVAEEVIPGKGPCYIYDDGSACQKIINGDTVNPKWGTTKAGKPRKRLGQACNTCREKKIKCDPSIPKCAQCQKFGRECRFESTTRSNQKSSSQSQSSYSPTSVDQAPDKILSRRDSTASTELTLQDNQHAKAMFKSMHLESVLSPSSVNENGNDESIEYHYPSKRARFSASPHAVSDGWPSDGLSAEPTISSTSSSSRFSWHSDPYELDRELTLYYLGKYFTYVDNTTYCTLPRKQFTYWVKSCNSKSPADRMMLYALLALGTVFCRRTGADVHRSNFLDIVLEASVKSGDNFNLQSLHTRLVLALLFFALGQYNRAWDSCGSAMRNALALRFNTEESVCDIAECQPLDFGLDRETLIECRRRAFWSAYVMTCFEGCCSASVTPVFRVDCHLRLPCPEEAYGKGDMLLTPFDLDLASSESSWQLKIREDGAQVGLLGYLVQVAIIFNEVMSRLSRPRSLPKPQTELSPEEFYQNITTRLDNWDRALKRYLYQMDGQSDSKELSSGLHIVYHYTAMVLHRYIRPNDPEVIPISTRVKEAYSHARKLLELIQRLSNDEDKDAPRFRFATTSPLSGFAITAALDVITAAGTIFDLRGNKSETMSLISGGIEGLEGLVEFWDSARKQRGIIKRRLSVLLTTNKSLPSSHNGAFYFGEPMQSLFGMEQDVVYGIPRSRYFQALEWEHKIHGEGDFHRLDGH